MDAIIEEALALHDNEVRDLALRIRNHENEYRSEREDQLWDLSAMISRVKHPLLRMSEIVTLVEAAPDEEAQLQTVMARLAKRGEWDPLIAELAIATVGPQDMDALVNFLESLAIKEIEHSKVAHGKSLVKCVACEEELQPKDLVLTTCGHCYCGSCLTIAFQTAVSDESLYPPRCCANTPIPLEHATRFLDSELEWTFEDKGVEFSTVDRTYCSDPTCSAFIPPDDYLQDGARCPKCWHLTCVVCKAPGHEGDCPADLELAALLKYAEDMRWQRCYSCLSVVQRQDGCSHMECRCGASFCYVCGDQINLDETSRCPCVDIRPAPYRFYRRPLNRWPPPDDFSATTSRDDVTLPETDNWTLNVPEPAPIWVGVPEENPVEQEQDRSRAGTPDLPDEVPSDYPENTDNGEQASIAESRRSLDQPPNVEAAGAVTPPDADATLPPVTSNADLVDLLRQLVSIVSARQPVLINQDHENEVPVGTGPASLRGDSASNHLSLGSDGDSQHTRSQTTSEDTPRQERFSDVQLSDHPNSAEEPAQSDRNDEDASVYQASDSSTISVKPTRRGRLRTRLSPHRLLRVLRKAAVKLSSDEKEIASKNDEERPDEEDVLKGDGRWSTTRTLAVAMKTTMGSESGITRLTLLREHLNCSEIQQDLRRIAGTRKQSKEERDG
ncbi:hypothetical protein KCU67_g7524, partial [Aureobasidium melanogenum]